MYGYFTSSKPWLSYGIRRLISTICACCQTAGLYRGLWPEGGLLKSNPSFPSFHFSSTYPPLPHSVPLPSHPLHFLSRSPSKPKSSSFYYLFPFNTLSPLLSASQSIPLPLLFQLLFHFISQYFVTEPLR